MAGSLSNDQVLGIILIVLGALVLFGGLAGPLVTVAAVALIVVGVLILLGKLRGSSLVGILAIAFGVLLLVPAFPWLRDAMRDVMDVLVIVVGVLLIIFGILKVAQR